MSAGANAEAFRLCVLRAATGVTTPFPPSAVVPFAAALSAFCASVAPCTVGSSPSPSSPSRLSSDEDGSIPDVPSPPVDLDEPRRYLPRAYVTSSLSRGIPAPLALGTK